jgi:DHA1 family bicyclomycin/chloramphenicol resistance-like MFS transporter
VPARAAGGAQRPRWGFIALLGAASGLSAFGMASVVPMLPQLERALETDFATLQFVVSAYLLGLGLFQPVQGVLCDRFGRRPVLLGGFSVFLVASLLASIAPSLPLLVLARCMQAMGASVATVVTRAIVRDSYEPEPAAVALAFITAVMGLSPVVAPLVGGVVSAALGWRAVFWMHAAMAGLLLALIFVRLRETRPAGARPTPWGELLQGFAGLLRERRFLGYSLTYSFVSGASFIFITVGAALFERLFGMSAAQFGTMWAGFAGCYVLGAASAGALSRRHGTRRVARAGITLNLLAAGVFGAAALWPEPQLAAFVGALALQSTSNGLVSPLALAGAVGEHPSSAGMAAGLSSSIAMLVSMACAMLTGVVYDGRAVTTAVPLVLACVAARFALRTALAGEDAAGGLRPGGRR